MSNHYETKQVILMRTDLKNTQGQKVRSGKLMAQAAHAAMMFMTRRFTWNYGEALARFSAAEKTWMTGSFAKIVLGVGSLDEMLDLVRLADLVHIDAHVCTDNGNTEFGGIPTVTCAAIGPATSDLIDRITGHLRPL